MAASSENMASIEPWTFRPSLDTWFADYIARDAETLTKALQISISADNSAIDPFAAVSTPTVSGVSAGSDQEPTPRRRGPQAATGKITKRKSRASKRSQTTFITADPANFRQMVQQVTGVSFGGGASQVAMAQLVKPEPQRLGFGGGRFPAACLPTLDTSAFLLDHHQQQQEVGHNGAGVGHGLYGPGPVPFGQNVGAVNDPSSFGSADFDTFSSSFPTLESYVRN